MNRSLMGILNWSVRVGSLFGIPISLHVSLLFFLLPLLSGGLVPPIYEFEYAVLIVLSILLHELGHALTAKHYRLTGLSIMLHGFGGFATSSGERTAKQALWITLAGPAVTFALGFVCLGISRFAFRGVENENWFFQGLLIGLIGSFNILMGILNLIPMLPFDGGNAVRALIWMRSSPFKGLRGAGHLGLIVSPIVFIYGFVVHRDFVCLFGLIGFITSLMTLLNSGGVRFGEFWADRRARKEEEAFRKRADSRNLAYLTEVQDRARKREEEERLRRILGD